MPLVASESYVWCVPAPSSLGPPEAHSRCCLFWEVGGEANVERASHWHSRVGWGKPLSLPFSRGNVPITLTFNVSLCPFFYCCFDKNTESWDSWGSTSGSFWEWALIKCLQLTCTGRACSQHMDHSLTSSWDMGKLQGLFCFWLKLVGFYSGMKGVC